MAGGSAGLLQKSLPELQLTAAAEETKTYIGASYGLQLEYAYLEDGTVEITKFVSSTSTDIEFPSKIDGKDVTSIGDYAFWECESLTNITIPDGVTSIGEDAFAWCENLSQIKLSNNLTKIEKTLFYYCKSLTQIEIPDSVIEIGVAALCFLV